MPGLPKMPPPADKEVREGESTRMTWTFEAPEQHWADHDRRQWAYWRTRPAVERLAHAAEYRRRRHGDALSPVLWTWRFLSAGEQ